MTSGTDDLSRRVSGIEEALGRVEQKVDDLSASVDWRFEQVDRRFEQVDRRFEEVDRRFEQIDRHFEEVDRRFDEVTTAIVEQRQYTEFAFERLQEMMQDGFKTLTATVDRGLGRLERKIDQLIDVQFQTNALVERRLTALESPEGP